MPTRPLRSIPGVCEVRIVRGDEAPPGAAPDLLLEVPHGATRLAHFEALRDELSGPFPEDLRAFFCVNTDVGAPEVAARVAERVVEAAPRRTAVVVRCLVPRTFVDCNRVIDAATRPSSSAAGQMTPGIASYVRDPGDFRHLVERYSAYRAAAEHAFEVVCGGGGTALMVHSYAPREVDVPVDERIVERLREAYSPPMRETWRLRAEVDLIVNAPDGTFLASEPLARRVEDGFRREGFEVARNGAYSLHPSSMGFLHATRWPGRTLCLEMRRDLLAREFRPFDEMDIDPAGADRMAAVLAAALA